MTYNTKYDIGETIYYLGETDGDSINIFKGEILYLYPSISDIDYEKDNPISEDSRLYLICFKTNDWDEETEKESIVLETEFVSENRLYAHRSDALNSAFKEILEAFDETVSNENTNREEEDS